VGFPVLRSNNLKRRKSSFSIEKWTTPVVFGLAAWLAFPSFAAHADLAGLLAGLDREGEQWRMVLTDSPAGSIHKSELQFAEAGDAGMQLPNGDKIAFTGDTKQHDPRSDEERVNRKDKKGRVVAVEMMQPPKAFSAGSILQRTSAITDLPADRTERTAFSKIREKDKPVELAMFYYRKSEEKPDSRLPLMLAELVTSKTADILATAYAPAAPDLSRESPFDAILKPQPEAGRFIPEISPDDHAWAATALPAEAFSPAEQQCLASGIYFESRGESVKGQAAVAQVILNRVRNPAYPKTICGVVYQNEDWRNRCQFSFACDNIKDRINSAEHWKTARDVAMAVTAGKIWLPEVGSATHYHAVYVRPNWAPTMKKVGRIGLHVFYRTYGGGWS